MVLVLTAIKTSACHSGDSLAVVVALMMMTLARFFATTCSSNGVVNTMTSISGGRS